MKSSLSILLPLLKVSGSITVPLDGGSSLSFNNIDTNGQLRRKLADGELWCTIEDLEETLEDAIEEDMNYALYLGSFFEATPEAPYSVECATEDDTSSCPALVYSNIKDDQHEDPSITPPLYSPTTHDEPCSKCNLHYHHDSSSYIASCDSFECLPPDEEDNNNNSTTTTTAPPENITVHYKVKRSDFFRTIQYTSPYHINPDSGVGGHRYTCSWKPDKKTFEVDFLRGITNARSTLFTLSNKFLDHHLLDPTPDVFDSCEYSVDGVYCASCRMCDDNDPGLYSLDCSNIRLGATAGCEEHLVNPFYGFFPKLFVVQEGYEFPAEPPTPAPIQTGKVLNLSIIIGVSVGAAVLLLIPIIVCFLPRKCKRGNHKQQVLPAQSEPNNTTIKPSTEGEEKPENDTTVEDGVKQSGSNRNNETTRRDDKHHHSHRHHNSHRHHHRQRSSDSSSNGKHRHCSHHHRSSHRHEHHGSH